MDDEEEDMSRPISQRWGTPFRDVKYEDRATQTTAGPVVAAQGHNNNTLPCGSQDQPRILFHVNAGFRSHFPACFEPMEDRGGRQNQEEQGSEEEEEHRMAERPEEPVGMSSEARIGQKLREIGDQFHQEHVQLFLRHQREQLPVWLRLTMALYGFLFQREGVAPRLRGEER